MLHCIFYNSLHTAVHDHHYIYTSAIEVHVNRTAAKRLHSVPRNSIDQVPTASTARVEGQTAMKGPNAVHNPIL
jgi:hypothetical protein